MVENPEVGAAYWFVYVDDDIGFSPPRPVVVQQLENENIRISSCAGCSWLTSRAMLFIDLKEAVATAVADLETIVALMRADAALSLATFQAKHTEVDWSDPVADLVRTPGIPMRRVVVGGSKSRGG